MAKTEKKLNIGALELDYRATSGVAQGLAEELSRQISKLLQDASVALAFPIQQRVKTWASISEKFERIGLHVESIREVQDLVGLRIIVLFRRDLARVGDLLNRHLAVLRTYDTADRLKEDQFGYASVHFIVRLPDTWLSLPSLIGMKDLQAEIQLRTLAQHMWAEASHVFQYKQERSVPVAMRRALYRGSAILETLDLEFDRILSERDIYRSEIDLSGQGISLNVDVLEKTLDSLFPKANKDADEPYAELVEDLSHFDIRTVAQLRDLIDKWHSQILNKEGDRVKSELKNLATGKEVVGSSPDRIQNGVFFTHVGLARSALSLEFGDNALVKLWHRRRVQRHRNDAT